MSDSKSNQILETNNQMAKKPMKEIIFPQPWPIKLKVEKDKWIVKEMMTLPSPIQKENVKGDY